jgi:hypothetical protein
MTELPKCLELNEGRDEGHAIMNDEFHVTRRKMALAAVVSGLGGGRYVQFWRTRFLIHGLSGCGRKGWRKVGFQVGFLGYCIRLTTTVTFFPSCFSFLTALKRSTKPFMSIPIAASLATKISR